MQTPLRFVSLFAIALAACAEAPKPMEAANCSADMAAFTDISAMRDHVRNRMAYPTGGGVDVDAIHAGLEARARQARTKTEQLRVMEAFVYQLGDHHAHLGRNDDDSPRLVPTGASVWIEPRGADLVVAEARPGSPARAGGLREGMVIDSIEGAPLSSLKPPPATVERADAMRAFAARVALAGTHNHDTNIIAHDANGSVAVTISEVLSGPDEPATLTWPAPGVAMIRLNNSIGSSALPPAFDKLMKEAGKASTILLDLRDTPSGGDTSVAKPLMSWFVKGSQGYQTHQRGAKTWTEQVTGRRDYFQGRLIILIDHWTGSMGEGTAIGLRSAAHAVLVGTSMAGLRGAIEGQDLPCSKVNFRLPVERLYEVGGGPRELAKPDVLVTESELAEAGTRDAVLERALRMAR